MNFFIINHLKNGGVTIQSHTSCLGVFLKTDDCEEGPSYIQVNTTVSFSVSQLLSASPKFLYTVPQNLSIWLLSFSVWVTDFCHTITQLILCEIHGRRFSTGAGLLSSFVRFTLLIVIPWWLHTHLLPCDSLTRQHIITFWVPKLEAASLTQHLAHHRVRNLNV